MNNLSVVAVIIIDAIAQEDQALDGTQAFSSMLQQVSFSPGDVLDSDSFFKLFLRC